MKKGIRKRVLSGLLAAAMMTGTVGSASAREVEKCNAEKMSNKRIQAEKDAVTIQEEAVVKRCSAVDFTKVKITDDFWSGRQKQVLCDIIKVGVEKVEAKNGGFNNFIEASKKNNGQKAKAFEGDVYFLDSDTYKMLEAMSYSLQIDGSGDKEIQEAQKYIKEKIESWIPYIVGAQEEDGYLDTFFTLERGSQAMSATTSEKKKWTDFAAHELYVDGHFYEAAVALYRANGDTRLLDAAIKNADLIYSLFGEGGSIKATSGHQEIELALLKLAAACTEAEADKTVGNYTGEYGIKSSAYVKLARRFLDLRGDFTDRDGYYSFAAGNRKYRQEHEAVANQTEAVGHVVRAMYQYIAMADVMLLEDSYVYDKALTSLWEDITETKSYITGGMGITGNDESFGKSYELPVNGAYSETCGSIGSVMWNYRMNMLYGDSKYVDVLERTLYNAVIAGVNFDGNKFFYQNPVSSDGSVERSAWFGCACCPPNLMRLINSLGSYIYTQDAEGINVNLYIGNTADLTFRNENVRLHMSSEMPWEGKAEIKIETKNPAEFAVRLRLPEWADGEFAIAVNGQKVLETANENGYVVLNRTWKNDDTISVEFSMEIQRTYRSEKIADTRGYTAICRGPLVYVAEEADNDYNLNLFTLPETAELMASYSENLTGGSDPFKIKNGVKITASGKLATINGTLDKKIELIPYYAWNNRGKGLMRTYLNESNTYSYGAEAFAEASASYTSIWQRLSSINDNDDTTFWCSWIEGSVKQNPWVQYSFDSKIDISGIRVNWMQDTAGVRVPSGIQIQYWDGSSWKNVTQKGEYNTFIPSSYNEYLFETVKTDKIRLTMNNKVIAGISYALAIYEWKVIVPDDAVTDENETENKVSATIIRKITANWDSSLAIQWKKVDKAEGYILYRATKENGEYKKIVTVKNNDTVTYEDKKVKADKKYYYKVTAYCKIDGKRVVSELSAAKGQKVKESAVKILQVKAKKAGIALYFDKVNAAKGYCIYRSTKEESGYKKIKTVKKSFFIDKTIKEGKNYYYKIRAYKGSGKEKLYGAYSNVVKGKKQEGK